MGKTRDEIRIPLLDRRVYGIYIYTIHPSPLHSIATQGGQTVWISELIESNKVAPGQEQCIHGHNKVLTWTKDSQLNIVLYKAASRWRTTREVIKQHRSRVQYDSG